MLDNFDGPGAVGAADFGTASTALKFIVAERRRTHEPAA